MKPICSKSILKKLLGNGCIKRVIGKIPEKPQFAFLVQARSLPKPPFNCFIALSKLLTSKRLNIYVDNYFSQIFLGRTDDEQAIIDEKYKFFFSQRSCRIFFSKDLLKANFYTISSMFDLARNITLNMFISCLPKEKRQNWKSLESKEIIHALMELLFLKHTGQYCDALLIGYTSQAILSLYRDVYQTNHLPAIITPPFKNIKAVSNYLKSLEDFKISKERKSRNHRKI